MKLKDYIGGSRRGREANRIEREALDDPLFREALEGFEMVDGSHSEVIDRLRTRVRSDSGILARNRRRIRVAAVASLLVIATGSAFLFTRYIPELGEYQDVLSMRSVREEVSSILNGPPAELAEKEDIAHADVVQGGIVADNIAAQERSASETAGRQTADRQYVNEELAHVDISQELAAKPQAVTEKISEAEVAGQVAASIEHQAEEARLSQARKPGVPVVSGKVVDDSGEVLAGVTVFNQTQNDYAATDANGRYTIPANRGDQLSFNYLGYDTGQTTVDSQNDMTAVLKQSALLAEEVVVTGYGTRKRRARTGSSAAMNADAMEANSTLSTGNLQMAVEEGYSRAALTKISVENAGGNGDEMAVALSSFYEKMDSAQNVSQDGEEGYVVVIFEVSRRGKPKNAEVASSLSPGADREALRMANESGPWPRTDGMVAVRIDFAGK